MKKLILILSLFTIIIGCLPDYGFSSENSQEKSAVLSAVYVLKIGTNLMSVGMKWFLYGNFNWSSKTNKFISELIHPIVGMIVGIIVFIVELIFNIFVFYIEGIILITIGLIITGIGCLLFPVVLFFIAFSKLFMPG